MTPREHQVIRWFEIDFRFEDTDTVRWAGQISFPPGFELDTPWYHCATCLDSGTSRFAARLSLGAKFCSNCGTELDWHTGTYNCEDVSALAAEIERETGQRVETRR